MIYPQGNSERREERIEGGWMDGWMGTHPSKETSVLVPAFQGFYSSSLFLVSHLSSYSRCQMLENIFSEELTMA